MMPIFILMRRGKSSLAGIGGRPLVALSDEQNDYTGRKMKRRPTK